MPPPAQPQDPQAECKRLVSDYVGAAQANDGPRAMAGYNALKSAGGCGVLDKVDHGPPASVPPGDGKLMARGARPLTQDVLDACKDGCADQIDQLKRDSGPGAQAAMFMNAVQVGLELGAAMANGMAAIAPRGGGGGGGGGGGARAPAGGSTDYSSIGNPKVKSTYGEGSPGMKCGPRGC
jgi:hypothetical protein